MAAAAAVARSRRLGQCPSRRPEARSLDVFIRAFLSAVSLVVLVPAAFAVIGGFDSRLPIIGPFGAVLNTGLPWVFGAAAAAVGLAGIVVVRGGRKARILLVAALAILIGAGFVGYRYMTFAADNGASYDPIRALDGFPPIENADKTVVFATVDGTDLHAGLWLPAGSGAAAPGSLPAVVFAHGGGFLAGGLGTRPQLLDSLRGAGIVGIDVEYRLAPPPRWDQAPGDVLCAMAWLRTSPELAMVDLTRVVVAGESAGGSLAMLAGYAAGTDAIPSSCPEVGPPVIPAGVFVTAPTADLEGIWHDATIHDLNGKLFPYSYIGGPPDQYPERYAAAEPFRLLRAALPPTVILAGETDKLVHIERSIALADRIRAAGAKVELLVAPFASHGFDGEPNSFGAQLSESLVRAFVLGIPPST
jgi:acetyl esterase/lipase